MVTFVMTMVITPRASYAQEESWVCPSRDNGGFKFCLCALMVTGLTVHPENPLLMDFIVSTGNSGLNAAQVKKESDRLIKYFLACLTIPENNQWVNLSPYEKHRIIPEDLGQTVLGQDMLAQDYLLKQLTASLIYPEKNLGKNFWDKVYAKASQMYGTTQIPVNTFNKVWILPDTAKVYEHNNTVFVVKSHLKVMLDEDYLALSKHQCQPGDMSPGVSQARCQASRVECESIPGNTHDKHLGSQIVRQIILPAIEQEVNTGKNFAQLRQIYNSMILAVWFKKNLKQALLNQVYTDKSKVNGVNVDDPAIKEKIYQQYLQAYKKGVFNYIKEEVDQSNQQVIPRKYFSGGLTPETGYTLATRPELGSTLAGEPSGNEFADVRVGLEKAGPNGFNSAMMATPAMTVKSLTDVVVSFLNGLRLTHHPSVSVKAAENGFSVTVIPKNSLDAETINNNFWDLSGYLPDARVIPTSTANSSVFTFDVINAAMRAADKDEWRQLANATTLAEFLSFSRNDQIALAPFLSADVRSEWISSVSEMARQLRKVPEQQSRLNFVLQLLRQSRSLGAVVNAAMTTIAEASSKIGQVNSLDGVSYDDLVNGTLARMVERDQYISVTTNPPLIKAYVANLLSTPEGRQKVHSWVDTTKIADRDTLASDLMTAVVTDLAKQVIAILKDKVKGKNVYFSVELDPRHSRDIEASLIEARKWAGLIGRENLMVKVLATSEATRKDGIIETLLKEGIQVNVTGIMHPQQYAEAVDAYFRSGAKVASFASLFASRWLKPAAELVVRLVKEGKIQTADELKAAIIRYGQLPNAIIKTSYHEIFLKHFANRLPENFNAQTDFSNLDYTGIQYFLVASNSNKVADYLKNLKKGLTDLSQPELLGALTSAEDEIKSHFPDDVSFAPLQGPYVLPTTPKSTLEYVAQKGMEPRATILDGYAQARALIEEAQSLGMNITAEGEKLYTDGESAFIKDYVDTLESLGKVVDQAKAEAVKPAPNPAMTADAVKKTVERFLREDLKIRYRFSIDAEVVGEGVVVRITQTDQINPTKRTPIVSVLPMMIQMNFGSLVEKFSGVHLSLPEIKGFVFQFRVDAAMRMKTGLSEERELPIGRELSLMGRGPQDNERELQERSLLEEARKVQPYREELEGKDKAMVFPGGIDLASKHLNMESTGEKVNITFDPAMIAQFKRGDFSGVRIQILDVVPISLMPLLGLKEEELAVSVA